MKFRAMTDQRKPEEYDSNYWPVIIASPACDDVTQREQREREREGWFCLKHSQYTHSGKNPQLHFRS
jgi:hypothetical protein